MSGKILYEWGRNFLRRIEIFNGREEAKHDIEKKLEIPTGSIFARIHERILRGRGKRRLWKK